MAHVLDLAGKRAIVTGASSGLGLHFAKLVARHGASVTLAARRKAALDSACAEITAHGGMATAVFLDVADVASIEATIAAQAPFDIVINNAGVSMPGPALEIGEKD